MERLVTAFIIAFGVFQASAGADCTTDFASYQQLYSTASQPAISDITGVFLGTCCNADGTEFPGIVIGYYGDPALGEQAVVRIAIGGTDTPEDYDNMDAAKAAEVQQVGWQWALDSELGPVTAKEGSLVSIKGINQNENRVRILEGNQDLVVGEAVPTAGDFTFTLYCDLNQKKWTY